MDLSALRIAYPDCTTFTFGDSEEMCDHLLLLVRCGKKTATCSAMRDYQARGDPLPKVGHTDIAMNWDGTPALAIEIVDVSFARFCDVDESFALAEGENDSLEGWQADHRAFFERNGGFDPKMNLVCQRFKVIKDFSLPREVRGQTS